MTADSTGSLSRALRTATQSLHRQVEQTGVFADLIAGTIELRQYCQLLRNLLPLYACLEGGLRAKQHDSIIGAIYDERLWRTNLIEQDLDHLFRGEWQRDLSLCAASIEYLQHLEAICADSSRSHLLVSHAYVRYLGDLSGGQMLQRTIARSLGLSSGQGTAFFDFGSAQQIQAQARRFRNGLDRIVMSESKCREIVDEAVYSFELHVSLAEQMIRS